MIKKPQIGLFFKSGETSGETPQDIWKRIKKSTELTLSMNAETEDTEYIVDEIPTTELERYKPAIDQAIKMIKDEPDFEFFWKMYYDMAVGEAAKLDILIAFMFDDISKSSTPQFRAWKTQATVTFDSMNANDSELSFTLAFGKEIKKGYVTVTGTAPDLVPTFVEGEPNGGSGSPGNGVG